MNAQSLRVQLLVIAATAVHANLTAHVTIRTAGPLRPSGYATVSLNVPNERHVDTVRVTLEVPDAFLLAGGRVSKIDYPSDWKVRLEKADKPADIYAREATDRAARESARAEREHAQDAGRTQEDQQAKALIDELRRKWIKRVVFEGGAIPPDGFKEFRLSLQLPEKPGRFRFPAVQLYADGTEVGWVQVVEGAERPAAELVIERAGLGRVWLGAGAAFLVLIALAGWAYRRRLTA